jgi:hypothetical protein
MGCSREMLENTICNAMGVNSRSMRLEIVYRCPLSPMGGVFSYVPVPINGDDTLSTIWETVRQLPPPKTMEVFVKIVARENNWRDDLCDIVGPSTQPQEGEGSDNASNEDPDSDSNCPEGDYEDYSDSGDDSDDGAATPSLPTIVETFTNMFSNDGSISTEPLNDQDQNLTVVSDDELDGMEQGNEIPPLHFQS